MIKISTYILYPDECFIYEIKVLKWECNDPMRIVNA